MKSSKRSKTSTLLAVLSSTVMVVTASSAIAMPVGVAAMSDGSALRRVADQHRVYPGSDDAAAQKARAERNAPNRFCEKQQQYCE